MTDALKKLREKTLQLADGHGSYPGAYIPLGSAISLIDTAIREYEQAEESLQLREAAERVLADRRASMAIRNSTLDALEAALREVPAPEAVKVAVNHPDHIAIDSDGNVLRASTWMLAWMKNIEQRLSELEWKK